MVKQKEKDDLIELDANSSIGMAAEALLELADFARDTKDKDTLFGVFQGWLEIHGRFVHDHDEPAEQRQGFGFCPEIVSSIGDVEFGEGVGEPGVDSKHEKFRVPKSRYRSRGRSPRRREC